MNEPGLNLDIINDFLEDVITEETLFNERTDDANRMSYNWVELEILKNHMDLFRKFLLKLSLNGRLRILLSGQIIGINQENLTAKYGIAKNKFQYFKGEYKPKGSKAKFQIRLISNKQFITSELYATIAIFTRVPLSWIQEEVPKQIWTADHFKDLPNANFTIDQLMDYIDVTEKRALVEDRGHRNPREKWFYDIRGVILHVNDSHNIFLRVAIYEFGGFIVELYNEQHGIYDLMVLQRALARFGPTQTGYLETVISNRINPLIVCKGRSQKLTPPSNFKTL